MWRNMVLTGVLAVSLGSLAGTTDAAGANDANTRSEPHQKGTMMEDSRMDRDGMPIAGYELMTEQERQDYRNELNSMDNNQQREAYRDEHRKMMEERAQAESKRLEALPPSAAGKPHSGYDDGMMNDEDKTMKNEGDKNMGRHNDEDMDTENE